MLINGEITTNIEDYLSKKALISLEINTFLVFILRGLKFRPFAV